MSKKIDANQPEIVSSLRKSGFHVMHTHTIGSGAPDLVVSGYHRKLGVICALLVEVKNRNGKLTDDEQRWHSDYPAGGPLIVARSVDDVLLWFGALNA